jgi:acetoin utilization deacetylase AcuC-like enzyme/predicted transcriptional regulator
MRASTLILLLLAADASARGRSREETRPVLLSLKPRHADRALGGNKWFEMRRIRPGWSEGTNVLVYASSPNHADDRGKPERAVVGCFTAGAVKRGSPVALWLSLGVAGASGFEPLIRTFKGKEGHAIRICEPRKLSSPVSLDRLRREEPGFRPPQMYQYINPGQRALLATLREGLQSSQTPRRGRVAQPDERAPATPWRANRSMGSRQLFVYHEGYNSHVADPLLATSYSRPAAVYRALTDAGLATAERVRRPEKATPREIRDLHLHGEAYVNRVLTGADPAGMAQKERKARGWRDGLLGLWTRGRATHARLAAGGSYTAASLALSEKTIVGNIAPGAHHVGKDSAAGVESFNGPVFAARKLIRQGRARRVMIIDGDLGYGAGTAQLTAGDASLAYVSVYGVPTGQRVHGANQHPCPVPQGASNDAYLACFSRGLAHRIDGFRPDLIIYNAGASPHRSDPTNDTARLGVSRQGLAMRDALVFSLARSRGVPVCWEMGSGYNRATAGEIHKNTALAADRVLSSVRPGDSVRFDGTGDDWRTAAGVVHFPRWTLPRGQVLGGQGTDGP